MAIEYPKRESASCGDYTAIIPNVAGIEASGLPGLASGWCCWRAEVRPGGDKPAKVPCAPKGHRLKVSDPSRLQRDLPPGLAALPPGIWVPRLNCMCSI